MIFECEMFIKNYSQEFNIISFLYVADPILILVKCNSFLYEKIINFVLSALIQIRFDVSQLLTLLSSRLRVNVNSRAFSSANEVDRVLSSANSTNLNKDDEFGRSFINITNNNGQRKDPYGTPYFLKKRRRLYQRIVTCRRTLEGLKNFTCYLEPSVCWNIFC